MPGQFSEAANVVDGRGQSESRKGTVAGGRRNRPAIVHLDVEQKIGRVWRNAGQQERVCGWSEKGRGRPVRDCRDGIREKMNAIAAHVPARTSYGAEFADAVARKYLRAGTFDRPAFRLCQRFASHEKQRPVEAKIQLKRGRGDANRRTRVADQHRVDLLPAAPLQPLRDRRKIVVRQIRRLRYPASPRPCQRHQETRRRTVVDGIGRPRNL